MDRCLNYEEFDLFVQAISRTHTVWAPLRQAGRGRFSDTDLLRYGPVSRAGEIVFDQKTWLSAKEAAFPATETMFHFTESEFRTPAPDERPLVCICRPCDINAFERLDRIFLDNGPHPDTFYKNRRDRLTFCLLECSEPFDTCFCVAMQANTTDAYELAIRPREHDILVKARSGVFEALLAPLGSACEFPVQFPQQDGVAVRPPQTVQMPPSLYDHPLWQEYARRCIACGRCNTSCPTCSCFSVHDITDDTNPARGERRRVWDGCHLDGFTDMAGNLSFRKDNGSRMRFKTFHKIYDYRLRFGKNMCTGCGRCDDVCPEYISFAAAINKVSAALDTTEERHG